MTTRNFLLAFVILALGIGFSGCKKADLAKDLEKRTLTVQLSDGVSGQPPAGNHSYDLNSRVNYSYTADQGYENLQVTLDGSAVASSGTVTMDTNHTLGASAQRLLYMQGDWRLDIVWNRIPGNECNPENTYNLPIVCAQDGDNVTVTIPSENFALNGTIDLAGNFEVKGEVIDSGIIAKYTMRGQVHVESSPWTITGTCLLEAYLESNPENLQCSVEGTINATRIN